MGVRFLFTERDADRKMSLRRGFTLNPGDNPWTDVAAQGQLVVFERSAANEIVERARGADICQRSVGTSGILRTRRVCGGL